MRYKVYSKTERAWDAMLEAIKGAKSSILLEMYIFVDDTGDNHDFIDILASKSKQGVKVKIVLDSYGSNVSKESLKKLQEAGVELLFYTRLFRISHRKSLIIDKEIAFIGGVNIKKYFEKWDDLFIRVEGKIVKYILRSFARMYKNCGGRDILVLRHLRKLSLKKNKVEYYDNYPPGHSHKLRKYYKDKIKSARESILLVTPYFMPNHWLRSALIKAAKKGVRIEIIMPRVATSPKISNIPNYFYMEKFRKFGIKSFLTKDMIHSKLMLIDGKEGVLGSQNLDISSFDLNIESGIYFTEKSLVNDLVRVAEEWKSKAVEYTPKMRITSVFDYFLEFCFTVFELAVNFYNRLTARIF